MHLNSTDYLKLLDQNDCALVLQRGAPVSRYKQDYLEVVASDGRPLYRQTAQGATLAYQPPRAVLDDFLAASLVAQDGPEDSDGRVTYRLTDDGRAHARS